MIESVQFQNLKALRDTTLPLGRFTLIVGPNGSGKSTALQALRAVGDSTAPVFDRLVSAGLQVDDSTKVEVILTWGKPYSAVEAVTTLTWLRPSGMSRRHNYRGGLTGHYVQELSREIDGTLGAIRIYSLDASSIATPTPLQTENTLGSNGRNLAGVLDQLRDRQPERFDAFNAEMGRWLPEFGRVLFETPQEGRRAILLRTRESHHRIHATELSHGTLLALAILTLAHIPDPPPIVCLEEPDQGIHPRLLRDVRDAMYRLSYPENYGEKRDPVQVIATTHSPYLLDLFKDHPEEVVIANKIDQDVRFERLSDRDDLDEILGDAQLGDAWYSGVLGGVPSHP